MEESILCRDHGRPFEVVCPACKIPCCVKCGDFHSKNCLKYGITLEAYATEIIMPRYKKMLDDLANQKRINEEHFNGIVQKGDNELKALKKKLEELLDQVNKGIDALERYKEGVVSIYSKLSESLIKEQKQLQEAIEKKNLKYLAMAMYVPESINMPNVTDSEKKNIEAISELVSKFIQEPYCEKLKENTSALIASTNKIQTVSYSAPLQTKSVYCYNHPSLKLYRFDIETKKLIACATVPQQSAVLQVGKQIFISGGYNNEILNTLSEYNESTQNMTPKSPMKEKRYFHKMIHIFAYNFAAIAGHDGSVPLTSCEEYSIINDKWTKLPALKYNRYSHALVLLSNINMYAIGGHSSNGTIEKLDLKIKKEWENVAVSIDKISIESYISGFALSSDEIFILPYNSTDTGIYNIKEGTVKKHILESKKDEWDTNGAYTIEDKVYTIGDNKGNIFIYSLKEKKLEIIEYNQAITK